MNEVALEFNHVWKKFKKGEKYDSLRDLIPAMAKRLFSGNHRGELQEKEFWALKDVSFQVKRGEALGIIGPNGAGKSTILKLLSGILRPNKGEMRVNGRLSALIEVSAGFHPDLTGRENIYLNGSILGMKKQEIDSKFDEIVAFSELEEFIDTPVKRFSSGMYARLGFSVAAHLDPDILLVDEVLSVGDTPFQKKCLKKIYELVEQQKTIVFISHNLDAVRNLCPQAILIKKGHMVAIGNSADVIDAYLSDVSKQEIDGRVCAVSEDKDIFVKHVCLLDDNGKVRNEFCQGEKMRIWIEYEARKKISNPMIGVAFFTDNGLYIYATNTDVDKIDIGNAYGIGHVEFTLNSINLLRGTYFITIALRDSKGLITYDFLEKYLTFRVKETRVDHGIFYMEHSWKIDSQDNLSGSL